MRAAKDDWYRNRTWNGRIDSNFEDHLKRTRNNGNKAEYLQIQGCCLLHSTQANIREVGVALLLRVLSDYPAEYISVLVAQESLGDYYLAQKNYEQAAVFFKTVINHCNQQHSRKGSSNMADLKWAEAILKANRTNEMEAAYKLVMEYPVALLQLQQQKLYYAELAAHICQRLDKKEAAAAFAATAISIKGNHPSLVSRFKKQVLEG
jgi:tetratricopeptide (TPR) repeat protein